MHRHLPGKYPYHLTGCHTHTFPQGVALVPKSEHFRPAHCTKTMEGQVIPEDAADPADGGRGGPGLHSAGGTGRGGQWSRKVWVLDPTGNNKESIHPSGPQFPHLPSGSHNAMTGPYLTVEKVLICFLVSPFVSKLSFPLRLLEKAGAFADLPTSPILLLCVELK